MFKLIRLGLAAIIVLAIPVLVWARIGVGVGVGKIVADTSYKAGGVYQVTSLPVINTGDEAADYEATIEFQENVPQLRPDRAWFSFSPKTFHLEPGQMQAVKVIVTLPVKTAPGDYFCYLEGHPINKRAVSGTATIGVAAAAKLYFTITPANIFQGLYWRAITLFNRWLPWSWVILAMVVAAIIILVFRRFFTFEIGISTKKK
jgi:P pilus assembly chaperone PapD